MAIAARRSLASLDAPGGGSVVAALPSPRSNGARPYVVGAVLCLVLATISLLFPSTPNYDPWAWLIWGREILHLNLMTSGGPTLKPLAMIFTTLFAPLGSIAPDLWLIVARAGAILAIGLMFALAFRLTRAAVTSGVAQRRSAGASLRRRSTAPSATAWSMQTIAPGATAGSMQTIAPLLAGVIAAVGLLVLSDYVYDEALGYSEGLMLALTLLAILRHLDGKPLQAFVLGFGASLDRPELWPMLGLYGLIMWRRMPEAHKLMLALLAVVPVLWFLPELWGSGSLVRGVQSATYPLKGAAEARCPFCAEVKNILWPLVITPFKISIVLLTVAAAAWFALALREGATPRRARALVKDCFGAPLVLLAFGIGFCLGESVLTEEGFSGNNRYLFLGACMIIVACAVAWAGCTAWLSYLLGRLLGAAKGIVTALAVSVAAFVLASPARTVWLISPGPTLTALRYQADLRSDLPKAIKAAGGAARLRACGTIASNLSNVPLLAWTLGMGISQLQSPVGSVLVQTRAILGYPLEPSVPSTGDFRLVADVGTVRIFVNCVS